MTGSSITSFAIGVSFSAIVLSTPAFAQSPQAVPETAIAEGQADMTDIVVTARKRNERLTDVPETITAFSAASLERNGIRNMDDLGRSLSNVVLNRRGDNEPNVVMRGVGAFGNVQGIGFYVDDVQNFTDQSARIVDLERVEVLKGPQGSLYGGSALGGAVKYVSKRPDDQLAGRFQVEGGGQDTINVNGSVNIPLTANLFARISAYTDNTDGYSRNPLTGVNNDKSREYGVRAALRFAPTDRTDIVASFRYSDLDNGGNDYYVSDAADDYRRTSPLSINIFNKRRVLGGILQASHNLDFATVTSITSFTERENRVFLDGDLSSADGLIFSQSKPTRTKVFTQELRLASEGDAPLSWLAGLYYASVTDRQVYSLLDLTFGPDLTGGPTVFIPNFFNSSSVEKTYAAFGNLSYTTGDLEVSLGARLNYNDFSGELRNSGEKGSVRDTIVLPKLSVSYKIGPEMMLYGVASKGYEPGRFNVTSDIISKFKPETVLNFELGAKGNVIDGAIVYEVAGFYLVNRNRQFETQIPINGVPRDVTANIGTSHSYGAEAALSLRPAKGLSIDLNAGYLHSEYKTAIFRFQRYDGNRVPYAPTFSGTAAIQYTTPVSSSLKVGVRADVAHNSGFYWNIPNSSKQPSYDLVGGRLALGSIDDGWELSIRVQNLFNKQYHTELVYNYAGAPDSDIVNGRCDECHLARLGQPRLILGTLNVRF